MTEVRFTWNANTESDLAGYKIYAGRASLVYDAVGSPKTFGLVTSGGFDIDDSGLWFFALAAVDTSGQEGPKSAELSRNLVLGLSPGRGN